MTSSSHPSKFSITFVFQKGVEPKNDDSQNLIVTDKIEPRN